MYLLFYGDVLAIWLHDKNFDYDKISQEADIYNIIIYNIIIYILSSTYFTYVVMRGAVIIIWKFVCNIRYSIFWTICVLLHKQLYNYFLYEFILDYFSIKALFCLYDIYWLKYV